MKKGYKPIFIKCSLSSLESFKAVTPKGHFQGLSGPFCTPTTTTNHPVKVCYMPCIVYACAFLLQKQFVAEFSLVFTQFVMVYMQSVMGLLGKEEQAFPPTLAIMRA